ncbi:unnamed protein product [Lymnaea stagnalis]|uniref:C-type lectin domain-containing protein n=1 Tax=Lymnaea stagnalis TaxID=6523 RepID=A0AAV2HNQ3_LYMST
MNLLLDYAIFLEVFFIALTNGSSARFDKITRPSCGPTRLSPGWVDKSKLSCAARCKARHPTVCRSFMYNKTTKLCTPGGDINSAYPSPSTVEGDLYYQGFKVVSSVQATVNVAFFYGTYSYADSETNCECLNSHLFVMDTWNKWSLLDDIVRPRSYTWIGLDDRTVEGKFVWANTSRFIDPILKQLIFQAGQPYSGNSDAQDCVAVTDILLQLDDIECGKRMSHICERPTYQ